MSENTNYVNDAKLEAWERDFEDGLTYEGDDEEDVCNFCKVNPADVDDFGCVICNDCLDKHPEINAKLNRLAREEHDRMY